MEQIQVLKTIIFEVRTVRVSFSSEDYIRDPVLHVFFNNGINQPIVDDGAVNNTGDLLNNNENRLATSGAIKEYVADVGVAGPQGLIGPKGDQGPQAIQGNNGADGQPGATGAQ